MKATDKRVVLKRMRAVRRIILLEISANARGGKVAAGLSNEGFAGGYLEAINDIEAALVHGFPSDQRHYWRRAANGEGA